MNYKIIVVSGVMNKKIFYLNVIAIIFFSMLAINLSNAQGSIQLQTVYSIDIEIFKNDNVILNSISAANATTSHFPTVNTDYKIKVLSNDGQELFNNNLGVSFTISLDPVGIIETNSTTINPRVPFYANAKYIEIYHSGKKILNIDLSNQFCNKNSVCDLGENQYNCSEDCKTKGTNAWFYVYITIAIIATIALLFILRLKRQQSFANLSQKWK